MLGIICFHHGLALGYLVEGVLVHFISFCDLVKIFGNILATDMLVNDGNLAVPDSHVSVLLSLHLDAPVNVVIVIGIQ